MEKVSWQTEAMRKASEIAQEVLGIVWGDARVSKRERGTRTEFFVEEAPVFLSIATYTKEEMYEPMVIEGIRRAGKVIGFSTDGYLTHVGFYK